ncbi:MAG: signal peptidase II [Pirellulaceae bacterium]
MSNAPVSRDPASSRSVDRSDSSVRSQSAQIPTGRLAAYASLAVVGAAIDLFSKQVVFQSMGLPGQRNPWWLWEPFIGIETAVNIGALFGMGAGFGLFFAAFSLVALVAILLWLVRYQGLQSWWITIALGLITGGILGNLYDRLGLWYEPGMPIAWKSAVRDWILLRYGQFTWPNFNIADSLLVVGTGMLLWSGFRERETTTSPAS